MLSNNTHMILRKAAWLEVLIMVSPGTTDSKDKVQENQFTYNI